MEPRVHRADELIADEADDQQTDHDRERGRVAARARDSGCDPVIRDRIDDPTAD